MEAAAERYGRIPGGLWGMVLLSALALVLSIAVLARPGIAHALPGDELRPIRGVAYQPAPSDYRVCTDGSCPYYDTDFFNADFRQLWGPADGGRDDLGRLADDLGANLIRLYNWNPARDHLGFLNYAHRKGLGVAVPISNYFVESDPDARANIERIVRQVYVDEQGNPSTTPHPAVPIWTVGNEFDIPPGDSTAGRRAAAAKVAQATAHLVAAEQKIGASVRLPVSAPVSFAGFDGQPPAVSATRMAIEAMHAEPGLPDDFVATRYAAAVNTFNPGSYLRRWLDQFKSSVPDTAVWFSELGINLDGSCNGFPPGCATSEQQQAAYIAGQWREAPPGTAGVHLGGAAFEFVNEPWKGGEEATFGLTKFAPGGSYRTVPTARGTYRVDDLVDKPGWSTLRDAFQRGKRCQGKPTTVGASGGVATGTRGDDVIRGSMKNDAILGRGGDDVICGRGGNDEIEGRGGEDSIVGNGGQDEIEGNGGGDTLRGAKGNDQIDGQEGNDKLLGGKGGDDLDGGKGNDNCSGGAGNDIGHSC